MNYYKRHLGDYAKKAGHLTMLEHGAYNLILDAYYDREEPLTETLAIRLARATTNDEIAAVKNILREFFCEKDGVYTQNRADEEIAHFHKRQKINKKLGKKGGEAKAKRIAKPNDSEHLASHKPLAISHKEEENKAATPPCPWLQIIELWNSTRPELPAVLPKRWKGASAQALVARWSEDPDCQTLDWWKGLFEFVGACPHLMGKNDRGWTADLRWLVKAENFAKVLEGRYQPRAAA